MLLLTSQRGQGEAPEGRSAGVRQDGGDGGDLEERREHVEDGGAEDEAHAAGAAVHDAAHRT